MSWFRIVNASKTKARIDIYDDIGEFTDWWTGEKTGLAARDFSATLAALDVKDIELHINSRGGSVPDGIQIYNELRRHPANITVVIDGQAASIASIIAMAGDEVVMPANTTLWIHDPMAWLDVWGYQNATELRAAAEKTLHLADDLDTTRDILVNTYLTRANDSLDRDTLVGMMARETTITAEQAVAWGLADRIEEPLKQAAAQFDMTACRDRARAAVQARIDQAASGSEATETDPDPAAPDAPGDDFRILDVQAPMELPQIAAAVNRVLAASGLDPVHLIRPAPALDATAVVALCREHDCVDLVADLLEAKATAAAAQARIQQVQDRRHLAADVRDLIHAGGLNAHRDTLVNAALAGPLEALRAALSLRMVEGEATIRSDHGGEIAGKPAPTFNVFSIQAARKAQR